MYYLTWNSDFKNHLVTQIFEELYSLTLKFLALEKLVSPPKKISQIFSDFCLPLFYATFHCGPYNIFKKCRINILAMKTLKTEPQKLLLISPDLFFTVKESSQPTA